MITAAAEAGEDTVAEEAMVVATAVGRVFVFFDLSRSFLACVRRKENL